MSARLATARRLFGRRTSAATATAAATADAPGPPPLLFRYRSSSVFIVATICLAIFTDIFLYGLVVPVMPFALTTRAGIADNAVQRWNAILLACYSGALFISSPVAGFFADRSASRRLPLLAGLLALAGATLMLCLGRSVAVYAVGRILQGASAGIVWSVGLALLADTLGHRMGQAVSYVSMAMALGLLLSPLIGGAIYAKAGYYAVYYVAFGIIVLDIMLRLLLIEKKVARRWLPNDDDADEKQTGADDIVPVVEPSSFPSPTRTSRFDRPVVLLLRSRRLLGALFGIVVCAVIAVAFDTVLSLFVHEQFGWSSTAAGLLFFAPLGPPILTSTVVGMLADRWGAKWPAVAGFAILVPVLVCLRFVDSNTIGDKVLLAVLLAICGTAETLGNVPLIAEVGFAIAEKEARRPDIWGTGGVYGLGYGFFTTAFALGSTAGSLMAGYLHARYGWATVGWSLAIWCAAGAIATLLLVGDWCPGRPTQPGGPQARQHSREKRTSAQKKEETSR